MKVHKVVDGDYFRWVCCKTDDEGQCIQKHNKADAPNNEGRRNWRAVNCPECLKAQRPARPAARRKKR